MISRAVAVLILSIGLIASGCGTDEAGTGAELKPIESDGPRGSIDLVQEGDQITGTIRLGGLEPGTAHAAHLHGEPGGEFSCAGEKTSAHLINFPDLVADYRGVAELSVDITAPPGTLRAGTYVMAHENPRTVGQVATEAVVIEPGAGMMVEMENPPIACADVPAGS